MSSMAAVIMCIKCRQIVPRSFADTNYTIAIIHNGPSGNKETSMKPYVIDRLQECDGVIIVRQTGWYQLSTSLAKIDLNVWSKTLKIWMEVTKKDLKGMTLCHKSMKLNTICHNWTQLQTWRGENKIKVVTWHVKLGSEHAGFRQHN